MKTYWMKVDKVTDLMRKEFLLHNGIIDDCNDSNDLVHRLEIILKM